MASALALLGTALLWWGLSRRVDWVHVLGCWLVAVNVVAFGYYGYDKARARSAASRVPEAILHGLVAVGGSLGAYTGMEVFRHKTVKGRFRILFWCIVALQVVLIAWLVKWWQS
ncbi:MAG: DUF1294 domain-containing protein [Gemmataceae bacterium]|nr:DUF1294 domain-containing protein [Gemmataceae bacterium]